MERYNVIEKLGRDANNTYFQALVKSTGQKVTLQKRRKYVPDFSSTPLAKLLRESLVVPNVLDIIEDGGKNIVVFQYLEESLSQAIERCSIGNRLKQKLIKQLISIVVALDRDHSIHLAGLSPELFFVAKQQVFLCDISIGKPSLRYMSPEQLEGRAGPVSCVFSLACIIVEILTEEPFIKAETEKEYIQFYNLLFHQNGTSKFSFEYLTRNVQIDPLDQVRLKQMLALQDQRMNFDRLALEWLDSPQPATSLHKSAFFKPSTNTFTPKLEHKAAFFDQQQPRQRAKRSPQITKKKKFKKILKTEGNETAKKVLPCEFCTRRKFSSIRKKQQPKPTLLDKPLVVQMPRLSSKFN